MKAYRQDFIAIATLVAGGGNSTQLAVTDITKDSMRSAFAAYARDHEAASIRRCWSTWNVLCTFLYTSERLAANPMQLVGRPKLARPLPKALPRTAVQALLETVARDEGSKHPTDWAERDLALILIALLAGLRSEELRLADIGDIRTTDNRDATIHVRGKGGKERSVPIEAELLSVIEAYLDSRAIRFPGGTSAKQATAPRPCRDGPRDHRYSSGVTANESPVEHCNHESSGPSSVLAPKRNPSRVPSFTGFGIPTRLNWPARTSAYTRL